MAHDHDHRVKMNKRLIIGVILNSSFVVVEFVFALIIGSLALLSDAGHNFADSFALILALYAYYQSKKMPTRQKTFGFLRSGVLAALFNSAVLIAITFYIFYEAYFRLINPPDIPGGTIIIVAAIGFVINSVIAFGFKGQKDINIKAAFLHLLTDALVSLGVLIAGIVIVTTGFNLIDPLISIAIGIFILYSTWGVTKEAIDILMEATPKGINGDEVIEEIMKLEEVKNVHHLHLWEIGSGVFALSCHIVIEDMQLCNVDDVTSKVEKLLKEKYGIIHPTIQPETQICDNGGECKIPHV